MKKFWTKYKFVFFVFLIWRIGLFIIGYWSIGLLRFNASFPYIREALLPTGLPQYIWHWANFDGVHYLMISQFGYNGIVNNEQVFFPLYPIFIRFLGGGLIPALFISNFFALTSGLLIYKHFGRWPLMFFFCFPTAFFLGSVYTESLFVTLIILTFYKSKAFGILAGLTRLTGFFTGTFGIIGVGLYMLYLQLTFNNPLLFLFNQGGFANGRANSLLGLVTPFQTVFRYLKILATADPRNIAFWISGLEIITFLTVGFVLAYLTYKRKFNFWVLAYSWCVLIIPSLTGTLTSLPRYVLTIFPLYIFLGNIHGLNRKLLIAGLFIIIQVSLTIFFVRGYFVA